MDTAPGGDEAGRAEGPLGRLVGDVAEFESRHWGRLPLIRSTDDDFADVWSIAALDEFTANGIRSPLIRLVRDGTPIPVGEYTGSARLGGRDVTDAILPERVAELFAGGATVVAQSLHRTESRVRGFLRALSSEVSHPVQANSYLTPPGSVGLAPHADNHDVFVVQIQGSKQWTVDGIGDFVVAAGDTVYIPAGTRHSAESTDVASLHLTVGVMRVTYRSVLNRLLRSGPSSLDEPLPLRYRSPDASVQPGASGGDVDLTADIGSMISDVARWLADVDPTATAAFERGRSAQSIPDGGAIGSVVALQNLDQRSLIARCTEPWTIGRTSSGRLEITTAKHVLEAPEACRPSVEQIAEGEPISVGELDGLDAASRLIIARRLISAGLCTQVGD